MMLRLVVCFKQKTAYEMRISDWSSDVCSSDLIGLPEVIDVDQIAESVLAHRARRRPGVEQIILAIFIDEVAIMIDEGEVLASEVAIGAEEARLEMLAPGDRSEEHTSELQSLMRISYAVLCLNKQKKHGLRQHNSYNT